MEKENQLTFPTHPLKNEILEKFSTNDTLTSIHEWLKKEHPEVVLSVPTLAKHKKKYDFNVKQQQKDAQAEISLKKKSKRDVPVETILWETINQCRRRKKDKNISVKDWQYLDQQLQSAVEKLMRIQQGSGDTRDISTVLSEIFTKIEAGEDVSVETVSKRELTEEEKLQIALGVDKENEDKVQQEPDPRLAELLFTFEGEPIKLYDYQKRLMRDESDFRIIMKARQLGFSWIIAMEGLLTALIRPYQTILIVSSGEEAAKRVLGYVYTFIHGMKVQPKLLTHSMTECKLSNHSRIVSLPNNDRTVRGYRAHKVYCDEFASLMNDEEILAAIQPSISRGGSMTIFSTPRGRANRFWDIWDDPESGFTKHRVPWYDCPDKDYRKMIKRMQKTMLELDFKQEYCCDPSISDMAFFTRDLLKGVINVNAHYLSSLETQNKVVMGIDFGKKVSSTAITIVEECPDMVKFRFQEELRNMPYDFAVGEKATQLKRISYLNDVFNVDEINIDATGVGIRLEEDMKRLFGAKVNPIIFTQRSKELLITNLKLLCEKEGMEIPNDIEFITQLLSLEKDITPAGNTRYKHVKGKKDDRVWSAALAVMDMMTPANKQGYLLGGDAAYVAVNEHLDSLEPRPARARNILLT